MKFRPSRFTFIGLAICLAPHFFAPAAAQEGAITPTLIEKHARANFSEFFEFLALPNDAIVPSDIQKNADWLEAAFRKRGFITKQLPNNGKPLVFAGYQRTLPNEKTVLFYMHFDGQPVIPAQWSQKSPWIAVLKQRRATTGLAPEWEQIDQKKLHEDPIDPEWRVFARSSSDDKGPIMMFLSTCSRRRAWSR
jgi:acetylornithine deacetylase/succinyl-diaminopimelate desuccinylase-like protein